MRALLTTLRRELRPLLGDASCARLEELAAPLPPFSVSGFECRLNAPRREVDFSVYVPRAPIAWPAALRADPAWARVLRMADTASVATWVASVQGTWLELDADGPASPLPSVFLHVEGPTPDAAALLALAARLGVAEPPDAATLTRCLRALPEGHTAHLQVGAMIPRGARNARLVLHGVGAGEALQLAADLGWRDAKGALQRTMTSMNALFDRLSIALELGATVGERLAIEGQFADYRSPRWHAALDWLVSEGLADEAWGRALLGWPGIVPWETLPAAWPPRVATRAEGRLVNACAVRRISHAKVAVGSDGRREAKMYLMLEHRMLSDAWPGARAAGLARASVGSTDVRFEPTRALQRAASRG